MSTLKHKSKGPQSMTANELKDGYSVWLNETFNWTRDFSEALCTEDTGLIEKMSEVADRDVAANIVVGTYYICLLYTSPSPRDQRGSRMPSSA